MTTYFKAQLDINSRDFVEDLKEKPESFMAFLSEIFKQADTEEIREAADASRGRQEFLQRFIETPQEAADLLYYICYNGLPYDTEEHEAPSLARKFAIELIDKITEKNMAAIAKRNDEKLKQQ